MVNPALPRALELLRILGNSASLLQDFESSLRSLMDDKKPAAMVENAAINVVLAVEWMSLAVSYMNAIDHYRDLTLKGQDDTILPFPKPANGGSDPRPSLDSKA